MIQICRGRPQSWHPSCQPLSSVWINFPSCLGISILYWEGEQFLKTFTLNIIIFSSSPYLSFFFWILGICNSLKVVNTQQLIVSTTSCTHWIVLAVYMPTADTEKARSSLLSKSRVLPMITKQNNAANRFRPTFQKMGTGYAASFK